MGDNKKIQVQIESDIKELIPGFLNNRRKDVEKIRQMLQENDLESIKLAGHTMKGNGAGFGFNRISELGKLIEDAAKANQTNEIVQWVDELSYYVENVDITYVD